ncbi:hypothetical protein [Demequina litorisediminis]|uniref:hypothetical protein n=1 Tax=Demequina litorisediminis TaxID=1849022 RepID=UPI0024E136F6|nr:hypothetical protein [Demequina litorisediminis]
MAHTRATRLSHLPAQAWAYARMPAIARTVVRERLTYLSPVACAACTRRSTR